MSPKPFKPKNRRKKMGNRNNIVLLVSILFIMGFFIPSVDASSFSDFFESLGEGDGIEVVSSDSFFSSFGVASFVTNGQHGSSYTLDSSNSVRLNVGDQECLFAGSNEQIEFRFIDLTVSTSNNVVLEGLIRSGNNNCFLISNNPKILETKTFIKSSSPFSSVPSFVSEGSSCGYKLDSSPLCQSGLTCEFFQCVNRDSFVCGDGICQTSETKSSCSIDCGSPPVCGDDICSAGETKGATYECLTDCRLDEDGGCTSFGTCPKSDCLKWLPIGFGKGICLEREKGFFESINKFWLVFWVIVILAFLYLIRPFVRFF